MQQTKRQTLLNQREALRRELALVESQINALPSATAAVRFERLSESEQGTDRQIENIFNFREVLGIGNKQPVPFEGESPEAYARRCKRA